MNTLINSVFKFNRQVVGIGDRPLHHLSNSETSWLSGALKEEAEELGQALVEVVTPDGDPEPREALIGQVDACIDAAIFALGGLARLGLTEEQAEACFLAVMAANFEKKAGVKPGRTGAPDAVKPEGWIGPEARIKEILNGAL